MITSLLFFIGFAVIGYNASVNPSLNNKAEIADQEREYNLKPAEKANERKY